MTHLSLNDARPIYVKETVTSGVSSVVSEAGRRAGSLLRTSQDELRSQAEGKAKDLSSALDGVARQLGTMADAADDPDSTVAQLSRTAAEQLRKQSQRLEHGGLEGERKSTRLNSSHSCAPRMPSSA